jgi:hypothetical protein
MDDENKPLAKYDVDHNKVDYTEAPNIVWAALLDLRYKIEVVRKRDYAGMLYMFDGKSGDTLMFSKEVSLAYGALFGPDMDDVQTWQNTAIEVIDGRTKSSR